MRPRHRQLAANLIAQQKGHAMLTFHTQLAIGHKQLQEKKKNPEGTIMTVNRTKLRDSKDARI